jgi:hypothetical protein
MAAYGLLTPEQRVLIDQMITEMLKANGYDPDNPEVGG